MKRTSKLIAYVGMIVLTLGLLWSCKKEDDKEVHYSNIKTTTFKVAIIAPLGTESGYKERFERTADWALTNMRNAQKYYLSATGDSTAVDLDLVWYDEDSNDLSALASDLANDDEVLLAIGPLHSTNIDAMAPYFSDADKPLIVPVGSSEDVIRKYSVGTGGVSQKSPFLWSLCETDVSQCEALLAKAWEGGAKTVALLAPDDSYGKTFTDWIPFVASEMGMELVSDQLFTDESDISSAATSTLGSGADCVICVTSTPQETQKVLNIRTRLGERAPRLLFSDGALSSKLLDMGDSAEGIEGVAQYADPTSGFQLAYENKFGETPAGVEAQLYDAVLLAGFTALAEIYLNSTDANTVIRTITSLGDEPLQVWTELGMRTLMASIKQGKYMQLMGASGLLRFDQEAYTSLLSSTYVHWMVYDGDLVSIDYLSSDGGNRTASTLASWNWQAKQQQTILNQDVSISYPSLGDQWAVLVQGSNEWKNYRHQADVLNMYQLLKANGYDDDHIILIVSDDIAQNSSNKKPGEVRTHDSTDDLYKSAVIDYDSDTLSVSDIVDILQGNSSSHLPKVLETTNQSNVLVFWSGHGCKASSTRSNGFVWRGGEVFSDAMLQSTVTSMNGSRRYRKMLLLFEPCYSENMGKAIEGIPGVLCFCSATSSEQSFADYYSVSLLTWMSDRFSNNLVTQLSSNPSSTFRDVYTYLVGHTLGSHVKVTNADHFGNLFTSTASEFVKKQ